MSQTYQTTGIVLKQKPFAENDLLVTILSPDYGLINAVAPGAKKYKSSLRGRIQPLVVNDFLIVHGTNLDRIIQADTKQSYPQLSQSLAKLTTSQYLSEIAINLAFSEQPQGDLYSTLNNHLFILENLPKNTYLYPYLCRSLWDILIIIGIELEVNYCTQTEVKIIPNLNLIHWSIYISFIHGGLVKDQDFLAQNHNLGMRVGALELLILQSLFSDNIINQSLENLTKKSNDQINIAWEKIAILLNKYLEFYLGKSLKSAEMLSMSLTIS
ncbi:MAG: DNA repair protein RecO [Cyanobacterium sp. T60_A2020_053]|nr:DNA repair protein RecO [Cyanobacterium sp. T60_A2020_053]